MSARVATALLLAGFLLALAAAQAPTGELRGSELLAALRAGGLILYFRHADTVIVGRSYPFYTLVGGPNLDEGQAAVVRPGGSGFDVVARLGLREWCDLAALPVAR